MHPLDRVNRAWDRQRQCNIGPEVIGACPRFGGACPRFEAIMSGREALEGGCVDGSFVKWSVLTSSTFAAPVAISVLDERRLSVQISPQP